MSSSYKICVGILAEETICFNFINTYTYKDNSLNSTWNAKRNGESIIISNGKKEYQDFEFLFSSSNGVFSVEDVTIGVDFHWQAKEIQIFQGELRLIKEGNNIRLINELPIDDYLCSVISSEMSATSSIELLKAHTVISRSWLIAQIEKSKEEKKHLSHIETKNERVRWYDREDHNTFHVCADDHCQRYQGLTRQLSPLVKDAIEATSCLVLKYDNKICDTRYYKCCGGITEEFDTCWEPEKHAYLKGIMDNDNNTTNFDTNLQIEENAEAWIMSKPDAFCNVENQTILKQVLNDFDQSTNDFYRWTISYTQTELSKLIKERSGIDFGEIIKLTPLERGSSGRISRLKIEGTKRSFIIGKELEIRKSLSTSHLYSSAFVVEHNDIIDNIPQTITLHGAGWGHGVGLCQIGAAVMADKGYTYKQILAHYFRDSILCQL